MFGRTKVSLLETCLKTVIMFGAGNYTIRFYKKYGVSSRPNNSIEQVQAVKVVSSYSVFQSGGVCGDE